jgi:hypothetical protein
MSSRSDRKRLFITFPIYNITLLTVSAVRSIRFGMRFSAHPRMHNTVWLLISTANVICVLYSTDLRRLAEICCHSDL